MIDSKELERLGAERKMMQLRNDLAELQKRYGLRGLPAAPAKQAGPEAVRRTRKPMSTAQKKQVALRMRKYWADKRKAAKAGS